MGAHAEGCDTMAVAAPEPEVPAVFSLAQNSPNPFNPVTTLRFGLPQPAQVTLKVYDGAGRLCATLLERAPLPGGFHALTWRGIDDAGRRLSSGIYFCRIEAGDFRATSKMTMLK
jgi:hypothetical protein